MKNFLWIGFVFLGIISHVFASGETGNDEYEVRLVSSSSVVNEDSQAMLRKSSEWASWEADNEGWMAIMDDMTGLPHRAWGPGIDIGGVGLETKHSTFVEQGLSIFGVRAEQLADARYSDKMGESNHQRVFQSQIVDGYDVLLSQIQTKWKGDKLVMWGADWWGDAQVPVGEILDDDVILSAAKNGVSFSSTEISWEGWGILPDDYAEGEFRLVRILHVKGKVDGLLRNYLTWVDAMTGRVWLRKNEVVHHVGKHTTRKMGFTSRPEAKPLIPVAPMNSINESGLVVISGQTNAQAHAMYPFEPAETLGMPHLKLDLGSNVYYTDESGGFITNETGGILAVDIPLEGRWSSVFTDDVMPSVSLDLQEGYNILDVSDNLKEASAYRNVNLIHDHMREWLTDFTALDFSMTTNIDVEGECNAFFDGVSINFFDTGGGCNPTSLIADVVYHEYGHAINSYLL